MPQINSLTIPNRACTLCTRGMLPCEGDSAATFLALLSSEGLLVHVQRPSTTSQTLHTTHSSSSSKSLLMDPAPPSVLSRGADISLLVVLTVAVLSVQQAVRILPSCPVDQAVLVHELQIPHWTVVFA